DRRISGGTAFRSENESGGGQLVFASRARTLATPGRSAPFCAGRVQRRRQSRPAMERWKRCRRCTREEVPQKYRFSRNTEIRRVHYRSLPILSTPWQNVTIIGGSERIFPSTFSIYTVKIVQ